MFLWSPIVTANCWLSQFVTTSLDWSPLGFVASLREEFAFTFTNWSQFATGSDLGSSIIFFYLAIVLTFLQSYEIFWRI